jgi:methylmalonyl-CoA mutase N-terminal domain/subunit
VAAAVAAIRTAAGQPDGKLMEPILEAVRARATLGEIAGTMAEVWGRQDEGGR